MTGFATLAIGDETGLRLTIKGVNHRFLDLSFRLPAGHDALETRLRRVVRERVRRGHVDVTLNTGRRAEGVPGIDEVVLAAYVDTLRAAGARLGLAVAPDLTAMLRLPGVLAAEGGASAAEALSGAAEEQVVTGLGRLLDEFDGVRTNEGAVLAAALRESLELLRGWAGEAKVLRAGVRDAHLARLRARMEELLGVAAGEVNEARLLTEAALLAERSDVEEELLRLEAHIASFSAALDAGGELGKRLDFLSQELNREANTVLSKTGSAAGRDGLRLTELGLACKAEIERMREQVQNIE